MAEESPPTPPSAKTTMCKDLPPEYIASVKDFFERCGIHFSLPQNSTTEDFYSDLIRNLLKAHTVQKGRVSCIVLVLPLVVNGYNGLHGGAVAAIAERVSIACARTAVAEDKQLFLGELSMSYLSAAPLNEVLIVEGSIVRSGRNLTVVASEFRIKESWKLEALMAEGTVVRSGRDLTMVASEFRIKESGKLACTSRATFYHMPGAKL